MFERLEGPARYPMMLKANKELEGYVTGEGTCEYSTLTKDTLDAIARKVEERLRVRVTYNISETMPHIEFVVRFEELNFLCVKVFDFRNLTSDTIDVGLIAAHIAKDCAFKFSNKYVWRNQ